MLETGHRHGLACQMLYTDTSLYVKKFRVATTVTANTSHSHRIRQSVFSGMVSCVKICILRRFCKSNCLVVHHSG